MTSTVLVAGASGLVGAAVADRFLDDGWDVVAVSRRTKEVVSDKPFRHLAMDLQDEAACTQAFGETYLTGCVRSACRRFWGVPQERKVLPPRW